MVKRLRVMSVMLAPCRLQNWQDKQIVAVAKWIINDQVCRHLRTYRCPELNRLK